LVKIQEMSHVFFGQYKLAVNDLVFLPPEALTFGKLSDKADVWTLGVILLLCISIEFDFDAFTCKFITFFTNLFSE